MRATHLICLLVDFFSIFVVFSQRLLKYSRSIRQPRLFCTPMFLRVHAATFPALWATAIRDQVLTRNRLTARGNYMTARHEKMFYMHSLMLGFSPVLLHAFSTMLGYSQLDIMYIILQYIFMFVSQEIGPGACCWHVLLSGSGAGHQNYSTWLPWLAWLAGSGAGRRKTTRC